MPLVFLSYSTKNHHFAELASLKLAEVSIEVWRDKGQLRPGSEWRTGIERGISESIAVLVALSEFSAESSYVTFEWAYALGKAKTVIPLKLESCKIHPRLEPIQHLDFSVPGALPWPLLAERIREIEADATSQENLAASALSDCISTDPLVKAILAYMAPRGYNYISFDRIRRRIDPLLTDDVLRALVAANPATFSLAVLSEGKPGLRKVLV